VLAELLRIALAIGLETRSVPLRRRDAGAGGLCTIRGRAVVILNEHTSVLDRTTVLADALAGRDLSSQEVPSVIRSLLADRMRSRSRLLLPQRRPGPGLVRCRADERRRRK
jgi:hypothetical protein